MRGSATRWAPRIAHWLFRYPRFALLAIAVLTALFAAQIPKLTLHSSFADLLPAGHPSIELHNRIRDTFGGANVILVAVEYEGGTVLSPEGLARLARITRRVDQIPGVNHDLLRSLTHRNVRKIYVTPDGTIYNDLAGIHFGPNPMDTGKVALERDSVLTTILSNSKEIGQRRLFISVEDLEFLDLWQRPPPHNGRCQTFHLQRN